jgi:hypothetical protein
MGHKSRFAVLALVVVAGAIPLLAPVASAEGVTNLVIDVARTQQTIAFKKQSFTSRDCAYVEKMLTGTGKRTLMRFDVTTYNRGTANLSLGNPVNNTLFEYSPCHNHYHFSNYALYELFSVDPRISASPSLVTGRKQAFCLMDTDRDPLAISTNPASFTCSNQGMSLGWGDTYGAYLDGQWLDITRVSPGKYWLRVTVNPLNINNSGIYSPNSQAALAMLESNYGDNVAVIPVQVPTKIPG